jgi:hypothetical protein
MNRQLDHMVRLVDGLLDASRITRRVLELRREHVELSSVIDRALETVGPLFARRSQSVTVDAQSLVPALVDPTRIVQIIGNLRSLFARRCAAAIVHRVSMTQAADSRDCAHLTSARSDSAFRRIFGKRPVPAARTVVRNEIENLAETLTLRSCEELTAQSRSSTRRSAQSRSSRVSARRGMRLARLRFHLLPQG